MQVREHVDQVRRLRGRGVDAAEGARQLSLRVLARQHAPRRPADDRERVAHVVGDHRQNRIPLGAKLAFPHRQTFGLELLLSLRGDQQPDSYGNGAEHQLVLPLVHRRQAPREDNVVADDGRDGDGDRGTGAAEQCRADHEQHRHHDVDVVARRVMRCEHGERAAGEDAGQVRREDARDAGHLSLRGPWV